MNNAQSIILLGIIRDLDYWTRPARAKEFQDMPMGNCQTHQRRERGNFGQALRDATAGAGLIRIDLAKWFGRGYSDSQRVMLGRAVKRLEQDGLLTRHALEGLQERYTHVRFTEAGEAKARELLAAQPAGEAADAS